MKKKTEVYVEKPKRKSDWVGRFVRIEFPMQNDNGVCFHAGKVMQVIKYRGTLTLEAIANCRNCESLHHAQLTDVDEWDVILEPENYKPKPQITSFQDLQTEIGKWSQKEFGGKERVEQCIKHLKKEVIELEERPTSLEEIVDCQMLILEIARHNGYSAERVLRGAARKLEVVKKRKYALNEEGLFEHIRE